jgi:hypothetical protein
MPFPLGSAYGDIGMKQIFKYISFFCVFQKDSKMQICLDGVKYLKKMVSYADVGPQQLDGFPRHRRMNRGDELVRGDVKRVVQNVQGNLSHLTHKIPVVHVEDMPKAMQ